MKIISRKSTIALAALLVIVGIGGMFLSVGKPWLGFVAPFFAAPGCVSNTLPMFTADVTDFESLYRVVPPPSLVSGILKTHAYLKTTGTVPVYAPVDSVLVYGAYYDNENSEGEYLLDFNVSCEVAYRFDHITQPVDKIRNALPASPWKDTQTKRSKRVEVKAGELIGYTTGTVAGIWDFGVYNATRKNQFDGDSAWLQSGVYTRAVCPFDFYPTEKREAYYALFGDYTDDTFVELCISR